MGTFAVIITGFTAAMVTFVLTGHPVWAGVVIFLMFSVQVTTKGGRW